MTLQSLSFLLFFAVTAGLCLLLGRHSVRAGRWCLTAASVLFYLWGFSAHALLGALVLLAGLWVTQLAVRRGGTGVVLAALWHVAVLLAFKYAGFFTRGAVSVGWAPLGLSFFTFQQLWYLKEVRDGSFAPVPMGEFVLSAFFFPTVSSGPILRPEAFFPQLTGERFLRPRWEDLAAGLYAVGCGMAKKVLLADSLGIVVNNGWARASDLSAPGAWLVILGYTLQLYLDFSGYCDIAAGLARILGLRLPVNFDSPYRALSVGEFWKRWHITLTTFLRECLYFPLGGSRRGGVRTCANILLVFLVSGLWHGAGWTFLLWGGLHGLAQVLERLWGPARERLPRALRWAGTFLFVNLAWIPFRAPSLEAMGAVLRAAVSGGFARPEGWLLSGLLTAELDAVRTLLPALAPALGGALLAGLYGAGLLASLLPGNTIRRMDTFRPTAWRCGAVCALLTASVLSFSGQTSFLYSNF